MSDPKKDEPPFTLIVSGAIRAAIRRLSDEAREMGIAQSFARVWGISCFDWKPNPTKSANHLIECRTPPLFVRRAALAPVYVQFAVHNEGRNVFVLNVRMLAF